MSLAIVRIGTAVPDTALDPQEVLRLARSLACPTPEQDTWLPGLYAGTGIHRRHTALPAEVVRDVLDGTRTSGSVFVPTGSADDRGPTTGQRMQHYADLAPPLAIAACRGALAGSPGGSVSHLVTVSCTGFFAPGLDRALVAELGLPATVARTHVGYMGCHGALNGLRIARAFVDADTGARVLLCAVELCSLHYHYSWDPAKLVANALFADGAAGVVAVNAGAAPAGAWRLVASGSHLFPNSADAMTWTVGDHGFEMTLGKNVPGLIARHLRPWLEGWLAGEGITMAQVGSWAVHPGGPRILSAVEEGLGLSADALAVSRAVFAEHGNMSSPTLLFILRRLIDERAARPCVALGFGPGLAAEAALFL